MATHVSPVLNGTENASHDPRSDKETLTQSIRDRLPTIAATVSYGGADMVSAEFHEAQRGQDRLVREEHRITIRDARPIVSELSLSREGFRFLKHEAKVPFEPDFVSSNLDRREDLSPQNQRYVDELMPLIRLASGSDHIVPQAGRIVVRATKRTGMVASDPIAPLVHLDYTRQAVEDAIETSCALAGEDVPRYTRVALFQTWRVLTDPPQDSLLAICDASTVSLDQSIPMSNYHGRADKQEARIETRLCKYDPAHRWYYLSDMRPDDLLLFKGYDSAEPASMTGAHVAFELPGTAQPNGRISVEARFLAFY